ncbi:hypothetical protein [Laribacter hongkongensis]|uniref:hypothetical protein n=1 Tax=Laribacter hongkongensis TaxID=168471 RepID=UPI001EFD3401|nr:hypothetical protein [Laribacter hongkongensis]MCG9042280.1 hypothetical protein [Laribacter hongkongensis]MCG9057156.1 hypothetical protein [Laribacter hongkongensis]MCG9069199.1 hypothetical protein [Laribacter hongkongensis]
MKTNMVHDLFKVAQLKLESGSFDLAVEYYSQLINLTENLENIEAKFGLGVSYLRLAQYRDAFEIGCDLVNVVKDPCVYELVLEAAYLSGEMDYFHMHACKWHADTQDVNLAAYAIRSCRLKGAWLKGAEVVDAALNATVDSIALNCEALMLQVDTPHVESESARDILASSWNLNRDPRIGFALAYACIRTGWIDDAVSILEAAGGEGEFFALKGWCCVLKEDIDGASECFSIISRRNGIADVNNPYELIFLAGYYALNSRWNAAAITLARLLNDNEGFYLESRGLANILLRRLHDYNQAYIAYHKIAAVNAICGSDIIDMVWIAYGKGDVDECGRLVAVFEQYFGLSAEINAAKMLLEMEQGKFCSPEADAGLIQHGKGGISLYLQAILCSAKAQYADAYGFLKEALEIYPSDLLLGEALVSALIEMSEYKEALDCAEDFLKRSPANFSLRSMALYCTAILDNVESMLFHDEEMVRYCADQYEEWLSAKINGDYAGCAYVLYCRFLTSKLDLFIPVDKLKEVLGSLENYLECCDEKYRQALIYGIFNVLVASDDDARCAEYLDRYPGILKNHAVVAYYHCRFSRYELAEKWALKALEQEKSVMNYDVLVRVYLQMGCNFPVVDGLLKEVLSLYPENKKIRWNAALSYQSMGYVIEADAYYGVGLELGKRNIRRFLAPLWNGESLSGKTLLLWREQGVGDEIYAMQWYADIIDLAGQQGGRVKIECDGRLKTLLRRNFPGVEIESANSMDDTSRLDFDFHMPVFDLRKHFFKNYPSVVSRRKYLWADAEKSAIWKERVSVLGRGLKVGVCWKSGLNNADRNKYYASIEDLSPLFTIPDISWVMLNYSGYQDDAVEIFDRYGINVQVWDDLDLKNDFEGCAALTENLDLVISAGSTPGSLALMLGIPVWFFAYGAPCVASEPTYERYENYPALTWLRHYSESYKDVFARMAYALETKGVIAAPFA